MPPSDSSTPSSPSEPCSPRPANGCERIDMALADYGSIFCVWDYAPAGNRALHQEFFDRLADRINRIPRRQACEIVFHMPAAVADANEESRSLRDLRHDLRDQVRSERRKLVMSLCRAGVFAIIGIGFLIASAKSLACFDGNPTLYSDGFSIGGWVFIWELISILCFQLFEHTRVLRCLTRLLRAPVRYVYDAPRDRQP